MPAANEQPEPPDEDAFPIPHAWLRGAEPFRGRRPAPAVTPSPQGAEQARALVTSTATRVAAVLDNRASDGALVAEAGPYIQDLIAGRRGNPTPLGAGSVWMLQAALGAHRPPRADVAAVTDHWVGAYGLPFTAVAGAYGASVELAQPAIRRFTPGAGVAFRLVAAAAPSPPAVRILRRLRAHLAAADQGTYDHVVSHLAELRGQGSLPLRAATSYLAPDQARWVADDTAALAAAGTATDHFVFLLASVTTAGQAQAILAHAAPWAVVRGHDDLLSTLTVNLGADVGACLPGLLDGTLDAATTRRILDILARVPTDDALAGLLARLAGKYAQPAALEAARRFPTRAMRLLAAASAGGGEAARQARALLRSHTLAHPDLVDAVRPLLGPGPAGRALDDAAGAASARVPDAPPDEVPALLADPPWQHRVAAATPFVLAEPTPPSPLRLAWLPGEREAWAVLHEDWARGMVRTRTWEQLLAGAASGAESYRSLAILALAPRDLAAPYLAHFAPDYLWSAADHLRRLLAVHGLAAADLVLRCGAAKPATLAPALLPLEGSEVAAGMARWLGGGKAVRAAAMAWFDRHPEAAARDLVPPALGKPGADRSAAEAGLRFLARHNAGATVGAAAAAFGDAAQEAVEASVGRDPVYVLPARLPALPPWLEPAILPQVLIAGRPAALPEAAAANLLVMLALCRPGDPYAGVAAVRDDLDRASLAELGWAVFDRWQAAGHPSAQGWVLTTLALTGDDGTVRRLVPLIRAWPTEGGAARAATGLDVLAAIGTPMALGQLHTFSTRAKTRTLRTRALELVAEVADSLELTPEELADRLVPDLGLDPAGTLALDYGPRRFQVGFDEQLRPVVTDESGARRAALPKPGVADDPARAGEAYARYSGLRKDVKTIATDQIRRLEQAMVRQRRWPAAEQRSLFIDHPLLAHLARRLVWQAYGAAGEAGASFRVAEDRTLADEHDRELTLPDGAVVGIAHPLVLGASVPTWSEVFADYEILQPFSQLARETYRLGAEERSGTRLARFERMTTATVRILGLSSRGWERGAPLDGGVSVVTYKPLAGGQHVVANLDPGIPAGAATMWPEQTITSVWLTDGPVDWADPRTATLTFGVLDDVTVSEIVRDLEHLR